MEPGKSPPSKSAGFQSCPDVDKFDILLAALAEIDCGCALQPERHFIERGERGSPVGFNEFLYMDIEPPEIDALSGIQLESRIRRSR